MYPLKIKEKYDPNNLANLANRFTTAYLWNYIPWDFEEWMWSHPWVDIVPEKPADEVYAVLDWKIFQAWEDAAFWKYVFIEHKWVPNPDNMSLSTTLYSCYEHLSNVLVKTWDIVKEWQVIWNTWNTWISYWEHLHFQIDKAEAPFHAYWPYDWNDVKNAWVTFSEWVNLKLWIDKAKLYTINPLVYLDKISKSDDLLDNLNFNNKPKKDIVINDPSKEIIASTDTTNLDRKQNTIWFSDIEPSDKYYDFINNLSKTWVVKWFPDNNFRPKDLVSRWEFLKIILLKNDIDLTNDTKKYFSDILDNSWQKKYVNTALSLWIISTKNPNFNPNDNISRVEAVKMYANLLKIETQNNYSNNFSDVKSTDWFAKYVVLAQEKNIFKTDTNFYPNKDITRYEVVSLLYNLK